MLQFTICILDKFQRANAETFASVARERDATKFPSTVTSEIDKSSAIAQNVAVVGEGVKSLLYATIFREIEMCEEKICNLELLLLEVEGWEDINNASEAAKRKTQIYQKRVLSLNTKIENAKKRPKSI